MNERARDLGVVLRGMLGSAVPAAPGVRVYAFPIATNLARLAFLRWRGRDEYTLVALFHRGLTRQSRRSR